jgi:hypothetical protein
MTYDTIVSNMAGELRSALAEKGFCHRIGIPRLINQELLKPTGKPRLANTSFGYQVSMNFHIHLSSKRRAYLLQEVDKIQQSFRKTLGNRCSVKS